MRPPLSSPLPLLLMVALWRGMAPEACSHGDVHQTIALLSAEIEAKPDRAKLLFERAALYANYDHWTEALADLDRVAVLEPAHELEPALRASILRRSGKPAEARALQEAYLQKHPRSARVRREYAQTLADLKDTTGALRELDAVIAAAQHPPPDAVALRLRLAESADPAAALGWLDGFLTKHPLPVFQEEALRMEVKLGRTDAALARMDRMIAAAPRPEFLLLRKADLLHSGGDKVAAAEAARAALSALAKLPPHVRSSKACAELESRAAQFLPLPP
jgi:predicted Zn-dependent protease